MAGYYIHSLSTEVFQQLTTAPTMEQCLLLADYTLDGLSDSLREYRGEYAADPAKWPLERDSLAKSIQNRLRSLDWYDDLTLGDAVIWAHVLWALSEEPGEQMEVDFQCENDGFLYWDAAEIAEKQGASMMAEPIFGNKGFRYSGKSRTELDLHYSIHLPKEVQQLREQLEKVAPFFESMEDEDSENREQFFDGLLEPVQNISDSGRVLWVQTDT